MIRCIRFAVVVAVSELRAMRPLMTMLASSGTGVDPPITQMTLDHDDRLVLGSRRVYRV